MLFIAPDGQSVWDRFSFTTGEQWDCFFEGGRGCGGGGWGWGWGSWWVLGYTWIVFGINRPCVALAVLKSSLLLPQSVTQWLTRPSYCSEICHCRFITKTSPYFTSHLWHFWNVTLLFNGIAFSVPALCDDILSKLPPVPVTPSRFMTLCLNYVVS